MSPQPQTASDIAQIATNFPGITNCKIRRGKPHIDYDDGATGKAAELLVNYLIERRGELSASALKYATALGMGDARPHTQLASLPVSVLMSRTLAAFMEDYNKAREGLATPPLAMWSNVLRWLDENELDQRDLGKHAVLSKRALHAAVGTVAKAGWLALRKNPNKRGSSLVKLTPAGIVARDLASDLVKRIEIQWRRRHGKAIFNTLTQDLATIVATFEIELPWCITGYGSADLQITGGAHHPEQVGPPYIPAHGQDWPVVLRHTDSDQGPNRGPKYLPLSALLSQALTAFTIDYERKQLGWLAVASQVLQKIPEQGTSLQTLGSFQFVANGKGLLERHLIVVVEPGKPTDLSRHVYLTPKGSRMMTSYSAAVTEVEQQWKSRYGKQRLNRLRSTLQTLETTFDPGLPDYPNNTSWLMNWE